MRVSLFPKCYTPELRKFDENGRYIISDVLVDSGGDQWEFRIVYSHDAGFEFSISKQHLTAREYREMREFIRTHALVLRSTGGEIFGRVRDDLLSRGVTFERGAFETQIGAFICAAGVHD